MIEDDPSIRSFCSTLLAEEGYRVETAIDGRDAILQLGCKPDLILLDLATPEMDGYEFLRRLRDLPIHRNTPVLVVTAKRNVTRVAGAQGIIRKPFEIAPFLVQVPDLLSSTV